MKQLFSVLLFVTMWQVGFSQTYNPANFTISNKAYGVAQAAPTDARSYYYDASLFIQRPYQSTAEVLNYLNISKYRTGNFPIYINIGGALQSGGTFSGGQLTEYWFKNGTSNSDLVVKYNYTDSAARAANSLQTVTNNGSSTTNNIVAQSLTTRTRLFLEPQNNALETGQIKFPGTVSPTGISDYVWNMPAQTGIVALTTDVPSNSHNADSLNHQPVSDFAVSADVVTKKDKSDSTSPTGYATQYDNSLKLNITTAASTYQPIGSYATTSQNSLKLDSTNIQKYSVGGLGDLSPDSLLIVAVLDSHSEQFNQNGGASDEITILRSAGGPWEKLKGFINLGGSGYTMAAHLSDPLGTIPTISTSQLTVNNWDYYGHKPTGAVSLTTGLAWRSGKAKVAAWLINGGTNDLILTNLGNQTQDSITNYISALLRQEINRIQTAYPQDYVILSIQNPFVARPASFLSSTYYPTYGTTLSVDSILIDKMNYGLRNAYLRVQNEFSRTRLLDSWDLVYGKPSASLTAFTQVPYLQNNVHGTAISDQELIKALAKITSTKPVLNINEGRKKEAEARATATSVNAWDLYAGYFRNNPDYKLVGRFTFGGAGTTYMDLNGVYTDFQKRVGGQPFYISVEDKAAAYFPTYSASATSGSTMRFISISPPASLQSAGAAMLAEIYVSNNFRFISNDIYVHTAASSAKDYFEVTIAASGNGFIDINTGTLVNRLSTKYLQGVSLGTLAVGGTSNSSVTLSTNNGISRTSASSFRILKTGDYTALAGNPAAIYFGSDVPSPKIYENVPVVSCLISNGQNNGGYLSCVNQMTLGGIFNASVLGTSVASIVTLDIYSLSFGARTFIGTISIAANGGGASLSSGNPTSVSAGQVYEAVITSSNDLTNGAIKVTLTPN